MLDSSGDLAVVQSKKNSAARYWNYADSFTYNAAGAVTSMQLGNGRWESTLFNERLQPFQIALGTTAGATDKLKLDYTYGGAANNGNVLSQTITVPTVGLNTGFTAVQTYSYDELNRLASAGEKPSGWSDPNCTSNPSKCWKQSFKYDRFGNRNFDRPNTTMPASFANPAISDPAINPNTNRITSTGFLYDAAGNTTRDGAYQTYTYDAENKQTEVRNSSSAILGQYAYDGDGKRVKKHVPGTGETTIFVYDATGTLVAEYSTIVQSGANAKVSYLTNDHLGTPRINTDQNGAVISRHDYHAFGEEIDGTGGRTTGLNYGDDNVRKQFTGYERDTETDLDFAQARYYQAAHGRFSSPDSFLNDSEIRDPLSWNLYAYVRSNPLKYVDPTGEAVLIRFLNEDGNEQTVQYLNGKLYSGALNKKGQFVRGKQYSGDNTYAGKVLSYLNTLKKDTVLGSRLRTLENSSRNHTIVNSDSEPSVRPSSQSNADRNRPTGSEVLFNADKPSLATVTSEKPEQADPILALAHELLGHSWDYDQGMDHRVDSDGQTSVFVPVPGRVGHSKPIKYSEIAAVGIENRARSLLGLPARTHYGGVGIPATIPKTKPPIFMNSNRK